MSTDNKELQNNELEAADLYGFTDDKIQAAGSSTGYFPVEANVSDVELGKCEYGTDKYGEYVHYWLKREKASQELDFRLYRITMESKLFPKSNESNADAFKRRVAEQNKRMREIAISVGVTVEDLAKGSPARGATYKDIMDHYCNVVNELGTGKAWMKVMRNKNGFPDVPMFGTFMESMDEHEEGPFSYNETEEMMNEERKGTDGVVGDLLSDSSDLAALTESSSDDDADLGWVNE